MTVVVVATAMTGKKSSHIGDQASPAVVAAVATAGKERLNIESQTPSVVRSASFERGNRQGGPGGPGGLYLFMISNKSDSSNDIGIKHLQ